MTQLVDDLSRMRMLMAGVYLGLGVSSTYGFSIFTDHLRHKYGYSQSDITTISTVGNCVSYCSFYAGVLFDYAGPTVLLPLGGIFGCLGFVLFGMTFDGTITTSSVALFALYQGITNFGLPAMDVSSIMPLMLQFPLERGYVVLIVKTFSGLGTAVLMAYFNGWFKAADSDRAEDNNYSGYAYFVGVMILLCSLVGTYFMRLPMYFPCAWRKKRLSSEEAAEREGTLGLYMSQPAPTRRLRIGVILVIAMLIFSTTQSIATAYVKTSRAGYLAVSIVAVRVHKHGVVERAALQQAVGRRGPDAFASLQIDVSPDVHVEATSSVLRLRGAGSADSCSGDRREMPQPAMAAPTRSCPHASSCLSFLEWNGEVFGGALHLPPEVSDTTAVLDRLHRLEHTSAVGLRDRSSDTDGVCGVAALDTAQASFAEACVQFFENDIEGPYAFVYYAHSLQLFLFGRDLLGRRSLLLHVASASPEKGDGGGHRSPETHSMEVTISSVAGRHLGASCTGGNSVGRDGKRGRCESRGQADKSDENDDSDDDCVESAMASFPSFSCCWQEVPNTGLFAISVAASSQSSLVSHYPWTVDHGIHPMLRFRSRLRPSSVTGKLEMNDEKKTEEEYPAIIRCLLQGSGNPFVPPLKDTVGFDVKMAARYLEALWRAVEVRVKAENCGGDPTRPIGVLFSGGIDCTVLAAVAHYVLPVTTPIELINVAFGDVPELAPDRLATFRAFEQLLQLPARLKEGDREIFCANGREWRLVLVDVPHNANTSHIQSLVCPGSSVIDMSIGIALWHAAQGVGRMQRVRVDEEVVSRMRSRTSSCERHKFYRVSSETTKSSCVLEGPLPTCDGAADETKFAPLLKAIISELEAFNQEPSAPVLLSTLGKDHRTTLRPVLTQYGYKKLGPYLNDASAAGVIAFAGRDEAPSKAVRLVRPADMGRVQRVAPAKWLASDGDPSPLGSCVENYACEARVLLLGMGADETLGGYTRHRRAFERRGVKGLAEELGRDFARLWKRNLGRDDRVVCDSGREGRYPYLDEGVLATLDSIATEAYRRVTDTTHTTAAIAMDEDVSLQETLAPVCCFTAEGGSPGVGDKKILRHCASMLGLGDVVRLQKRAIQFGSRVAQAPS